MLKDLLVKKFCTHRNTKTIVFYQNECGLIPVIKVYKKVVCEKCGKVIEKVLVSEYPSCYYDIAAVKKNLQKKGIPNLETILAKQTKPAREIG